MEYSSLSVIITNYNYNKYLQDAIDSCRYADEVIVVDDCSKEIPKIKGFDKFIISGKNKGLSYSRNLGVSLSTGDRIICLDADDLIDDDYIKLCKADKTKNIIYGNYRNFTTKISEYNEITTPEFDRATLLDHNYIPCPICFKKNQFMGYDENMKNGYEDWDFLVRMSSLYDVKKHNVNMFYYRQHDDSMVNKTKLKHKELKLYVNDQYKQIKNENLFNK